jgi:hypothetical protein
LKFLRSLLKCLAVAAAIAVVVAAVALTPPFQTWYGRMELDGRPDLKASLGFLWARFGKVDAEDLRMDLGDAVLTLPSVEARMPIMAAVRRHQVLVRELVAKGWTLDLSRIPAAASEREADAQAAASSAGAGAQTAAGAAQAAAGAFAGILSGWSLPADVTLDGVDLEGDVLVALSPGKAPVRVQVTIKGGGLAAGREGAFTVDAETVAPDEGPPRDSGSFHGRITAAMLTPRTVGRVGVDAEIAARSGAIQEDLTVKAAAEADPAGGSEKYTLDVARGERHLAAVAATFHRAAVTFDGIWKADLRESDLAPFLSGHPLPQAAAAGNGSFDADGGFARLHVLGRVSGVTGALGVLAPALAGTGSVAVSARFDLVRAGGSIRFSRLDASLSQEGPVALVQALQPFDLDEATGGVKVQDPGADWLEVSIKGLPLAWLPALPGGFMFADARASGEFLVRAAGGGLVVRPKTPLRATGASVKSATGTLGSGLDLSLTMSANYDANHLEVQWSPLEIGAAGTRLASVDVKGTRPAGLDQPMAVAGTCTADLAALASQKSLPGLGWVPGRQATCEFTGSIGSSPAFEGKVEVLGHDPGRTVSATVNIDTDSDGAVDFLAPLHIAFGTSVSEISAEGTWGRQKSDPRLELKLTSADVALDQLLFLAGPFAAATGAPARVAAAGGRIPFWGNWAGNLKISFDKLRTGDQDFTNVGGSFDVDPGSVQLEGGHGELPPNSLAKVDGSVSFDPGAPKPYTLKGTLAPVANLDSALLLPAQPGQAPVIEGHFTLAGTITGSGASLDELVASTQEEFQLSSTSGIVRLLTTNVADAVPEAAEPVSDSLDTVGNFVGNVLLGIKGHSIDPSKNKVNKREEAVLNFTNQVAEIEYDKVAVTAVRGPDRTIRLVSLEMTAPDEHLRGTGQITYARGLPFSQEPLSVELSLGVRDVAAKLLSSVGLLSPDKDELGYPLLNQPIRFAGSLAHIDDKAWHDLLAKAMAQKPADGAKKEKPSPAQ